MPNKRIAILGLIVAIVVMRLPAGPLTQAWAASDDKDMRFDHSMDALSRLAFGRGPLPTASNPSQPPEENGDAEGLLIDPRINGNAQNSGNENPGGENPGGENPGDENPGDENPGDENPGDENPGGENPGDDNPGNDNPGNDNPGNDNPGNNDHNNHSGGADGTNPGGHGNDSGVDNPGGGDDHGKGKP